MGSLGCLAENFLSCSLRQLRACLSPFHILFLCSSLSRNILPDKEEKREEDLELFWELFFVADLKPENLCYCFVR